MLKSSIYNKILVTLPVLVPVLVIIIIVLALPGGG
jgi:hypothetical protein